MGIVPISKIKSSVKKTAKEFDLRKVTLFGSYANGTNTEKSDIDLLIEFNSRPVSIYRVAGVKVRMQELLGKEVDVIHGPVSEDALLEIYEEVLLYG